MYTVPGISRSFKFVIQILGLPMNQPLVFWHAMFNPAQFSANPATWCGARLEMSQTIASMRTPKPAVRRLGFSGDLCLQVSHSRRLSATGRRTQGILAKIFFWPLIFDIDGQYPFFPTLFGRQFHRVTVVFRRSAIGSVTLNFVHQPLALNLVRFIVYQSIFVTSQQ
jgi:hypothetical protein